MASYEQNCIDYAINGNPARDAADYEEAARFDQYDGRREEFYDTAEEDHDRNWFASLTPAEQEKVTAENKRALEEINEAYANSLTDSSEVPF